MTKVWQIVIVGIVGLGCGQRIPTYLWDLNRFGRWYCLRCFHSHGGRFLARTLEEARFGNRKRGVRKRFGRRRVSM